jgi:hypothetical protein
MTPEDIFSTFLRVLNEAYEADPKVLHTMVDNRLVCTEALADHPSIQVATTSLGVNGGEFCTVGLLGILNGICEPLTGRRVAAKFSELDSGERGQLLGFVEYKSPSPAMSAIGITVPQKTKGTQ